jgi:hypothetical protein
LALSRASAASFSARAFSASFFDSQVALRISAASSAESVTTTLPKV